MTDRHILADLQAPNLHRLEEYEQVSLDVETTGTYWYRDTVFGIAVAARTRDGVIRSGYWDVREQPQVIDLLRHKAPFLKSVINHNNKFDLLFLNELAVRPDPAAVDCTMVRAALIYEHERSYSLDSVAKQELGFGKEDSIYQELAAIFGGKPTREAQMPNLHRAPVEIARKYARIDPALALLVYAKQQERIDRESLHSVCALERKLLPVLVDLELGGVKVDVELAHRNWDSIDREIELEQDKLNEIAGRIVNVNSPVQMRALFGANKREDGVWVTDSGHPLDKTDSGAPSIDAAALRTMEDKDPRAQAALQIRSLVKAKSFLKDHILGHEVDGYVYPNYNQTKSENDLGTGTGRFSIDDPALQQIPKRNKKVAALTRSCFIPDDPRHKWLSADWDQFEFRWFAHYVNNPGLNKMYEDDPESDFHKMVSTMTGLPRSARFPGDPNAKQINLGLVFGMGQGRMAAEMGLPFNVRQELNEQNEVVREWLVAGEEAKKVFEQYHESVPGVQNLLSSASSIAKSRGYVMTIMGRHIRFPRGMFTHKAGGLVFQGSSADCMKQKMVELHPIAKELGCRMLLSVHDELDFDVPEGAHEAPAVIKEVLETFDGERCPIKCRIPIRSSVTLGPNWWEASK